MGRREVCAACGNVFADRRGDPRDREGPEPKNRKMNVVALLFDLAPSAGSVGAMVAVTFLLLFLGVAVVAYKALKKTVKMAFRLTIVAVILLIAVVGSVSLWYFSGGGS